MGWKDANARNLCTNWCSFLSKWKIMRNYMGNDFKYSLWPVVVRFENLKSYLYQYESITSADFTNCDEKKRYQIFNTVENSSLRNFINENIEQSKKECQEMDTFLQNNEIRKHFYKFYPPKARKQSNYKFGRILEWWFKLSCVQLL